MKKIALYTIIGNYNYGNKLQHYASQEILKKFGFEVFTINNQFQNRFKELIKYVLFKRTRNFYKFDKKIVYSRDNNSVYDYYIIGSDQVWNTTFLSFKNDLLLYNIDSNNKISFSSSFGMNKIDKKNSYLFKNELQKFKAISVREESGKKIVESLTNRNDVAVLLDPTMILTNNEWNKVLKKPKGLLSERYILIYFLGELSEQIKNEIKKIAKIKKCRIINLMNKYDKYYNSGPSEFLYLEKNAFLICTDSFHSSVFAILFDRPFIVFDRKQDGVEDMNSRIDTLLNKFQLQDRRYTGKITEENLKHDYSEVYNKLEKEREKATNFLKKALDIKEQ